MKHTYTSTICGVVLHALGHTSYTHWWRKSQDCILLNGCHGDESCTCRDLLTICSWFNSLPPSHTTLTGTYIPLQPGVRHAMLALTWSKNADTCDERHTKIPPPRETASTGCCRMATRRRFSGVGKYSESLLGGIESLSGSLTFCSIVTPTRCLSLWSRLPCLFYLLNLRSLRMSSDNLYPEMWFEILTLFLADPELNVLRCFGSFPFSFPVGSSVSFLLKKDACPFLQTSYRELLVYSNGDHCVEPLADIA